MPTLVSTQTFVQGNVLNADALTNHVIDAKPLATFISGQDAVATPAPADEFLIATAGASPAKKVTFTNLAANLPTGTSAASLTVTGATTLTGALTANGNTILGDAAADTLTVNATSSFGSDTTLGTAAVASATWARTTTTLTVTKTAHGLTSGNTRYLVFTGTSATPVASSLLNGTYTVTVTNADTFTVTVADVGDVVGTVTWYEKSLTLNSTLIGSLQGDVTVNLTNVTQDTGDEFLIRDATDNKLKTVSSFFQIRAYGNIVATTPSAVSIVVNRVTSPSPLTTVTKADHGMRAGDVFYMTVASTVPAGWYAVTSVVSSSIFAIGSAGTGIVTNISSNWYPYIPTSSGNISSVFFKPATQAFNVNFTNKPASSDYSLTFGVYSGTVAGNAGSQAYMGTNGPSGLDVNYIKTLNGFGVAPVTTAGGLATLGADGTISFHAIW